MAALQAKQELQTLGGRTIDLSAPIKQTEQLVDRINRGKISWDEYKRAAGASSKVVSQQLALQRSEISNIRADTNGKLIADFDYGNIEGTTTSLQRLAMQAKVSGAAGRALGQEWIDVGKNMAFSARQLTISLTAPFAVVSAFSIKAYLDTAEALTDIAKVYGDSADGFEKSADKIKGEARDLARTMSDVYAASYKDTYDHQRFYAAQGLTGADLSGSTQQAIRLQMLGDVDTKDAQQAITTLTNVYGIQTEKMGQYVDYMNKIEDSTTLTMQDFSAALPKIGPIIKSFEDDPKEATKAMAEMLEAGKRGGIQSAVEIANAWKSIYTKVARPTEQLKDVWQELGGKNGIAESFMGIVTKNGGDVMAIIKEISVLTADWDDVDKNRLFSQLAGAQQVARMTTFAQQLANSSDTIKKINEEFDNDPEALADNSRRQQDLIMESAEKRWAQFVNRLRDVGTTIGASVFPPIIDIFEKGVSFVEAMVNGISKIPGPLQTILKILGGFTIALGPGIGVLGALTQVSGQMFKIWSAGQSVVGNVMNKMAGGIKSNKLMTVGDAIRNKTEGQDFQTDVNLALMDQERLAREKSITSFNRLSSSVDRASAKLTATASAMDRAPGTGLTEKAAARRERVLTPAEVPTPRSVFVPPRPEPPKVQTGQAYSDYAVGLERHLRGTRLSEEAKIENAKAMQQFKQHEAYRKKIEERYRSFSGYMQKTDPAILDSNYQDFRTEMAPGRLQNSDFMKRMQSQMSNSIDINPNAVLDRQKVANRLTYTNRDIAALTNQKHSVPVTSAKWLQTEKAIAAAKAEQIRLTAILKGSTAGVSAEAQKIEAAYRNTNKMGMAKFSGPVEAMRAQNNDFIRTTGIDVPEMGSTIPPTSVSKSGMYQASNRKVRKTVRQALKKDPNAFAGFEDDYSGLTDIPMAGKKSSGNLFVTPEILKQAQAQLTNMESKQTNLANLQQKITDNSAEYAQNIGQVATLGGSLLLMFGPDNALIQTVATLTTTMGGFFMMAPEMAGKMVNAVGQKMAPAINTISSGLKNGFADGAGGFASGIIGNMQAKFMGFSSWLKSNSGAIMGWGAALAAAAAVGYLAYQKLTDKTREYRDLTRSMTDEAKTLTELMGIAYVAPMPERGRIDAVSDEVKNLAKSYEELETFGPTIERLMGRNMKREGDIQEMRLALTPKAIKILSSGGTEGDVNKMVQAALVAAGADQATIENFKLNLQLDKPDTLIPESTINSWKSDLTNTRGMLEGLGTGVKNFPSSVWAELSGNDQNRNKLELDMGFVASAEDEGKRIAQEIRETMTVATNEAKPDVMARYMSMFDTSGYNQDSELGKNMIRQVQETRRVMAEELAKSNPDFNNDEWGKKAIENSSILTSTMLTGAGAFKSSEEASQGYNQAMADLEAAGMQLTDSQRMTVANLFRTGAGMEEVAYKTGMTREEIDKFKASATEAVAAPKTFEDLVQDIQKIKFAAIAGIPNIQALNSALRGLPEDFTRRWNFYIDINNADEIGQQMAGMLREAGTKSTSWGMEFAAKEMDNQHQAAMDGIKKNGDNALKALEGQQKAAENAMKEQEKALTGKHKAQTKAMDNQIKEEQKQFDNQQKAEKKEFDKRQKEEKKVFDKQQKADQKLFDKDLDRQKKEFDQQWKNQEDSVKNYYDASKKYLEAQQAAEDKLDKSRQRNAEAERKRQEMLNNLANQNVDINVAIAGGNLDEAAKLMNEANSTSQTYFANAGQALSDAQSEDTKAAIQARVAGLSEQEKIANDVLAMLKERETEVFNEDLDLQKEAFGEKQEGERDAFGEKQSDASETFQDRLSREKEEFQLRLDARKEQLQLQQEQEKEFLNATREAEQEYFNNKRAEIQATTDASIKGAEAAHNARKEAMARELELLKIGSAATEQEVKDSADRLLRTYDKYGVDLGAVGDKLQGGMIENFHAGLDQAAYKMREDERWQQTGAKIGAMIKAGIDAGLEMNSGDILNMVISGNVPLEIERTLRNQRHSRASAGNADPRGYIPGKATGGPIFGAGTATSDSIPAMLSNGEHVLTAAEVRAFGGHAAIEKWRKDILNGTVRKFALGGGVGTSGSLGGEGLTVTVSSTGTGTSADGGVLAAVTADVQNLGVSFDQAMAKTAAPAWQLFGDQLIEVNQNAIKPTFEAMQQAMANVQAETTNTTAGIMAPAWYMFGQNLINYKTTMWDFVTQSMMSGLNTLGTATNTAMVNQIMPAWQQGANHIQNMQNNVIDPTLRATRDATDQTARNFETAADQIGVGWGKVKENTAAPVRFTIDTVFNKGLVGMWNEVADKLDLETFNEFPLRFATGGVLPGYTPGRDVHKFVSPTGGALHLSGGEAIMRPEWTRSVGGPAAVAQMNNAAKSGNLQSGRPKVPGLGFADGPGPIQKFAEGGVVEKDPSWDYTRGPNPAVKGGTDGTVANGSRMTTPIQFAMWDSVRSAFPGVQLISATRSFMTEGRPDNHNGGTALDLSPSPAIAQWLYKTHRAGMKELIFMPATGHSNVLSGQDAVWTQNNHYDHVHWAQGSMVNPWSGGVVQAGDLGGWGGGMGFNPVVAAAVQKFTQQKDDLKKKVESWTKTAQHGIANKIPMSAFDNIGEAMNSKVQEAAALLGGSGSVTLGEYGKNAEFYVKEIIAAAKERRLPMAAARIAIATALVESELNMWANPVVPESLKYPHDLVGGDLDSIGLFQQRNAGWGTVAERMNPRASAGMFYNALMKLNWQAMEPGAAAQAVQISAYPGKYTTRMGEADSWINRVGWDDIDPNKKNDKFDSGGVAKGRGFLNKDIIEPERVLSASQTRSFDTLVNILDKQLGRKSNVAPATPISAEDYMSKINNLDLTNRPSMSDKEYTPKSQEEIVKSLQPIFNAFQSFIQQSVLPGVIKYTTELIQMKTDEERLKKVSDDIINGIEGIYIPSNNEVNMVFGGTVYGDGHLIQIMEDYKRQVLAEVRAISEEAARRVAGK